VAHPLKVEPQVVHRVVLQPDLLRELLLVLLPQCLEQVLLRPSNPTEP
jgi:hypothetical protein